jgi:hypothetical protein
MNCEQPRNTSQSGQNRKEQNHEPSLSRTVICFRFQQALKNYGVADVDVFQTVDLWEKKDIAQVTTTLFALGRTVSLVRAQHPRDTVELFKCVQ